MICAARGSAELDLDAAALADRPDVLRATPSGSPSRCRLASKSPASRWRCSRSWDGSLPRTRGLGWSPRRRATRHRGNGSSSLLGRYWASHRKHLRVHPSLLSLPVAVSTDITGSVAVPSLAKRSPNTIAVADSLAVAVARLMSPSAPGPQVRPSRGGASPPQGVACPCSGRSGQEHRSPSDSRVLAGRSKQRT